MGKLTAIQIFAVWVLPVLFAITLHEVAHGWAALYFGDKTAAQAGRLSLNPLHHIDLIGTIIVPAILLSLGGFIMGWAKPVPVDWSKLKNPRRDMALVALAGPAANLGMALFWALMAKLGYALMDGRDSLFVALIYMGTAGIIINLLLMILNLLPLPPLDGSRVVSGFLPPSLAARYNSIEPYGFFIILALLLTGILSRIIMPLFVTLQGFIDSAFGLL